MPEQAAAKKVKLPEAAKLRIKKGIDVLYSWKAPERIWKPKDRAWYLGYAVLFLVLILVAARLGYLMLIIALLAMMFLWFVQGTIQPWITQHKITSKGIFTHDTMFRWDTMRHFWFARKEGWLLLHIDFKKELSQPRITLLADANQDDEIFSNLLNFITYADPDEAEYNALAKWIYGEYIPISYYVPDLDMLESEVQT